MRKAEGPLLTTRRHADGYQQTLPLDDLVVDEQCHVRRVIKPLIEEAFKNRSAVAPEQVGSATLRQPIAVRKALRYVLEVSYTQATEDRLYHSTGRLFQLPKAAMDLRRRRSARLDFFHARTAHP